jgi:3'(2'), 5'-bisphosphate nucleotidase
MSLVRLIDQPSAPLLLRDLYAGGDPGPIVGALAQVPELCEVALPFVGASLGPSSVSFRHKEIAVLRPQLGVIYVPATKVIYFADVLKREAFKSELTSHETSIEEVLHKAIPLQPKQGDSNPIQVVGSRSHMSQETLDFIDRLKQTGKEIEIVSKGSSLKFCLVAEGNADVYPRYAPTMEWDTAAGQAICNAVGIEVISKLTNQSLLYNKENLLNPWFLVSKQ